MIPPVIKFFLGNFILIFSPLKLLLAHRDSNFQTLHNRKAFHLGSLKTANKTDGTMAGINGFFPSFPCLKFIASIVEPIIAGLEYHFLEIL